MGAQTLDDFFIGEAGTLGWLLRAAETGGRRTICFLVNTDLADYTDTDVFF